MHKMLNDGWDGWRNAIKATENLLDNIDIEDYLSEAKTLTELMNVIDNDYKEFTEDSPVFKGYVFNWMNEEEFQNYLKERYKDKVHFNEETITHIDFKK